MNKALHWTAESAEDFRYKVAYDFVNQVEFTMDDMGLRQADLADRLHVTPGRVSQFFNNPGNMSLKSMVEWARVLGRKVAVVLYNDGDAVNVSGPVHSEVFRLCWERLGKPTAVADLSDAADSAGYLTTGLANEWSNSHLYGKTSSQNRPVPCVEINGSAGEKQSEAADDDLGLAA